MSIKDQLIEKLNDRTAVIGTSHDLFDYDPIFKDAFLVVDTRGRAKSQSECIFRA